MTRRREIIVPVKLIVDGDAPLEAVLAVLGTDMEDAVRAFQENEEAGFGLPDGCDLIDWEVGDPQATWASAP